MCSPTYGQTEWTRLEFATAHRQEKPLLPVWHSGPYPPREGLVDMVLGNKQRIPVGDFVARAGGYVAAGVSIDTLADELADALQREGCMPSTGERVYDAAAPPAAASAPPLDAELAAFMQSCSLNASQCNEVAVALRGIGVSCGSHLDMCHEDDLQQLTLPPVTLRVLRARLKTRIDAAEAVCNEAGRKAEVERKANAADAAAADVEASQRAKDEAEREAKADAWRAQEEAALKQAKDEAFRKAKADVVIPAIAAEAARRRAHEEAAARQAEEQAMVTAPSLPSAHPSSRAVAALCAELSAREADLGRDHPEVSLLLTDLAALLSESEQFAAAQPLYERALVAQSAALGERHPESSDSD